MNGIDINITGLTKKYGTVLALDQAQLAVGANWRCLGMVGRNTAGKTTMLRILVGLLEKDAGAVRFGFGDRYFEHVDSRQAVFISEVSLLPESLTGREYLSYQKGLNATLDVVVDLSLLERLIQRLRLTDQVHKRISGMSKGTKRKLELVAALATRVPLIVADELTEGLDIPSMREVQRIIREAMARDVRFLVSSHDVAFLTGVADKIAVIDNGRFVDLFDMDQVGEESAKTRIYRAFEHGTDEKLSEGTAQN